MNESNIKEGKFRGSQSLFFFHPSGVSSYQPQKGGTVNAHNWLKITVTLRPQTQKMVHRIIRD